MRVILGDFEMDNPKTKDGLESLGLFQESSMPVSLHVDTGFDFEKIIFKQTLLPLTNDSETIIFKNRFYGCSTTFSINPTELAAKGITKDLTYKLYNGKEFDKNASRYLKHEEIENLRGLE